MFPFHSFVGATRTVLSAAGSLIATCSFNAIRTAGSARLAGAEVSPPGSEVSSRSTLQRRGALGFAVALTLIGLGAFETVARPTGGTVHAQTSTPRTGTGPIQGPGAIAPGTECGVGVCPGFGTVSAESRNRVDSTQDCGAPVNVQLSYQGVTVNTGSSQRNTCPLVTTFVPECGQSTSVPGCCILSSVNLWESQTRWRCVCTSRSIFTLFITCAAYRCEPINPPLYVGLHQNCMNAQACSETAPADGCNTVRNN